MFSLRVRDGLEIVLLEERHAAEILRAVEDDREYLSEWLPWADTTHTEADVVSFIRKSLEQFARHDGFHAGIRLEGRYAGGVGVHFLDWRNRKTEIGYWLRSGLQGKGIMTDVCHRLIRYLFLDLGLHRVELRCGVENRKSVGVAERLGFAREGLLRDVQRLNGHFADQYLYALLATDPAALKILESAP